MDEKLIAHALKEVREGLPRAGHCPEEEALARFVEEKMEAGEAEALEGHLASCPQCCEQVVSLHQVLHLPEGEMLPEVPEEQLRWARSLVQEKRQKKGIYESSIAPLVERATEFIRECFTFEWVMQPLPVAVKSGVVGVLLLLVGSTVFFYYQGRMVPLTVKVEVLGRSAPLTMRGIPEEQTRVIREGGTVYSQEHLRIAFEVDHDAYAYVVLHDSAGRLTLLYPDPAAGEPGKVKGGTRLTVPGGEGSWFQLDDTRGEETVYVLAAREPIAGLEQTLASLRGSTEEKIEAALKDTATVKAFSLNHR